MYREQNQTPTHLKGTGFLQGMGYCAQPGILTSVCMICHVCQSSSVNEPHFLGAVVLVQ